MAQVELGVEHLPQPRRGASAVLGAGCLFKRLERRGVTESSIFSRLGDIQGGSF
jgi:hypothetical protein